MSTVATKAKLNQLNSFEAVCNITCEKPAADSISEEFSESTDLDDSGDLFLLY